MYKMDIREGGGGWSKNRILGRTPLLNCKATKNYKIKYARSMYIVQWTFILFNQISKLLKYYIYDIHLE